jgi:hypothetical protein
MIPEVDVPTVHCSTIVCFESYLIARLSLLTSTFLSSIMNFLSCELVQFNPNAIAALSCFAMLCECWLGIALDTSLFWYFYSPVRYTKVIYSGIELSLCRHRSQQIWMPPSRAPGRTLRRSDFSGYACLAVVGEQASVPPPPFIKDKRGELPMTLRLAVLVKREAELREAGLKDCHCAKKFTLRRIRPLGHRAKLAFN